MGDNLQALLAEVDTGTAAEVVAAKPADRATEVDQGTVAERVVVDSPVVEEQAVGEQAVRSAVAQRAFELSVRFPCQVADFGPDLEAVTWSSLKVSGDFERGIRLSVMQRISYHDSRLPGIFANNFAEKTPEFPGFTSSGPGNGRAG